MERLKSKLETLDIGALLRRLIISWLSAVTVEYIILPASARSLDGLLWLDAVSPIRIALVAVIVFALLTFLRMRMIANAKNSADASANLADTDEGASCGELIIDADEKATSDAATSDAATSDASKDVKRERGGVVDPDAFERCLMMEVFYALVVVTLFVSFTLPFAVVCVLAVGVFFVYAEFGSDTSEVRLDDAPRGKFRGKLRGKLHDNVSDKLSGNVSDKLSGSVTGKSACSVSCSASRGARSLTPVLIIAGLAVAFVVLDSIWTICRIDGFATPTFDFGIFAQMFYNMKETGIPYTTLERDGLLSHFAVHLSPIYYLILPLYMIFPYPATIQVAQSVILASAVIPLYKLCRLHGLSDVQRTALCAIFLFYPAISGGTSYDLHENCFLLPLVLWLLYGIDKKSAPIIAVSLILTLAVKEDAAVYCAVIALYLIVRALIRGRDKRDIITGAAILVVSLIWFAAAGMYINVYGDGTLANDRYPNFLAGDASPLATIVKTAIVCPMKLLYESVDVEKLTYLMQTMLPLLALPLITRRYERYILLLPYLIVNLVSDYQYLHDIFFQYNFGTTACLFYLAAVNLADIKIDRYRMAALLAAAAVTASCFGAYVVPKAYSYTSRAIVNREYYDGVRETLDLIPDDASVTATTFYTTYLSSRETLHDVRYSSEEHMLSTDYIVVGKDDESSLNKYGGFYALERKLIWHNYKVFAEYGDNLIIYARDGEG